MPNWSFSRPVIGLCPPTPALAEYSIGLVWPRESPIRPKIARMLGFDPAVGLLFLFGALQGGQLFFGQHDAVLGNLGLQGFEALLEGFQVVPQPNAPHAARRDEQALLAEFVAHPHLAVGGLFDGHLHQRKRLRTVLEYLPELHLVELFGQLRDNLAMYFAMEEAFGYFEDPL